MMLHGDYFTLAEAAEFIASKTGKKKNIEDVLRDATNGKVRLCVQFDGELSKFSIINKTITCEDYYGFVGYIQIPKEKISINNEGDIQFTRVRITEISRPYYKSRDPLSIEDNEWLAKRKTGKSMSRPECENFFINVYNDTIIPEQDLHDFIAQNQAERSLTNNESSASTSKAGAIGDAIIECLRSNGYYPLRLPRYKNGLPGVKSHIRNKLSFDKDTFDRKWQDLLNKKLISYIPKEIPL